MWRHAALLMLLCIAVGCDRRRNYGANGDVARVTDAIPQIEKASGLKFKSQPRLERRSRAQVREFLLTKFAQSKPARQIRTEEEAFKLFGLIPDTLNYRNFLLELLTEQIVGYYDPSTKVLYVVEGAPDDLLGVTITHELVHALQDQYINLDSIEKQQGNSDRQAAAQAVLEGHATYEGMKVMLGGENLATRIPGGWNQLREQIRDAQSSMPIFANAPMAIQESLLFPYLSGAEFVRRYELRRPGASPLDSLPVSTEQVLSEAAYFGTPRDMPTPVTLPGRRDSLTFEEELGEFGTRLFIFQHLKDNGTAINAAAGWDGDRFRIVNAGRGRGIVWASVWDTSVDAAEFVDALGEAMRKRYNTAAVVAGAGGSRTYSGSGRTVVITPREVDGRNVVVFVDVPAGAPTSLIDPARITLGH